MGNKPLMEFGNHLRSLRRRHKESLAEVSGAVEIDVSELGEIEAGNRSPSEDIVLLLISHFSLREDEAIRFWKMAGFDQSRFGIVDADNQADTIPYTTTYDNRILYTDMVHVSANNYGVVVNFLQGLGAEGKPAAVARIGMSREHAKSLIDVLERTISMAEKNAEPKPPKQISDSSTK